jgi:signal transduction histidine kinase
MAITTTDPPRRPPADAPGRCAPPPAELVVGVSCPVISAAARRVVAALRAEGVGGDDLDTAAGLVAALALAADRSRPTYVSELVPHASTSLTLRLVDLLRAEIVRGLRHAPTRAPAARILDVLGTLEQVRDAVLPRAAGQLDAHLGGAAGLDLLVEIAHDLRSPLTSILFLSETLQGGQSGAVNDVQRRQLGLIYSAALGLSALVSDAVELLRGGDRLVEDETAPFSVAQTLEAVRDMVRPMAEEKNLIVRTRPPPVDQRLGHPVAVSRVLLNLTCNALKFTEQGFVELEARERGATCVEFSVRDTGSGIDPHALTRLYQPFRRARGSVRFSGTGLGLTICRRLVEAMGSKLEVETHPGWGTRFFFELDLPAAAPA